MMQVIYFIISFQDTLRLAGNLCAVSIRRFAADAVARSFRNTFNCDRTVMSQLEDFWNLAVINNVGLTVIGGIADNRNLGSIHLFKADLILCYCTLLARVINLVQNSKRNRGRADRVRSLVGNCSCVINLNSRRVGYWYCGVYWLFKQSGLISGLFIPVCILRYFCLEVYLRLAAGFHSCLPCDCLGARIIGSVASAAGIDQVIRNSISKYNLFSRIRRICKGYDILQDTANLNLFAVYALCCTIKNNIFHRLGNDRELRFC